MSWVRIIVFWSLGGLFFGFWLLFSLLLSFIFPLRKIDPFLKWMLRQFFKVLGMKVQVEGLEYITPGKSYLYMVNHVSFLDIPLVGGFVPGFVRGIESARQYRWPLYGLVMGRLGNIPIERESIYNSLAGFEKGLDYLKEGVSLIIFPEGGRTTDGQLKSFKKLPFHLAKRADCEVVPLAICGLFELNNKNSYDIRPGVVTLRFGKPLTPKDMENLTPIEIRASVKQEIIDLQNQQ